MIKPNISIILPTFNSALTIEETLNSIIKQSYKNFEVIVGDDGSKDETILKIKKFLNFYSKSNKDISFNDKIKIFQFKHSGLTKTLNKCLEKANGQFAVRLDSDDLLSTHYLSKIIISISKLKESKKNKFLILSNYKTFKNNSKFIKRNWIMFFLASLKIGTFFPISWFPHSGAVFPLKSKYEKVIYDEYYFFAQDRELWLRLFSYDYEIIYNKDPDIYIRESENSLGSKNSLTQRYFRHLAIYSYLHYLTFKKRLNKKENDHLFNLGKRIDKKIMNLCPSRFYINIRLSMFLTPFILLLLIIFKNILSKLYSQKN